MELKDIARGVPDEIWTVFEPHPAAGRLVRQRPPAQEQPRMLPRPALRPGQRHRLGDAPPLLPLVQDRPAAAEAVAGTATPSAPPGGSWPSDTSGSTASTGTRSSSTAPRSRQKRG